MPIYESLSIYQNRVFQVGRELSVYHRCVHTDFIAARKSFCTIENRIGMHTGRIGRTVRLILIKHHTIVASTALFMHHCCVLYCNKIMSAPDQTYTARLH